MHISGERGKGEWRAPQDVNDEGLGQSTLWELHHVIVRSCEPTTSGVSLERHPFITWQIAVHEDQWGCSRVLHSLQQTKNKPTERLDQLRLALKPRSRNTQQPRVKKSKALTYKVSHHG